MKRRRGLKILLIVLAAFVAATLLMEAAVRLRQRWKHGTTRSYYEFVTHPESGLWIPAPSQRLGPIETNSLGFRGPEIEVPKPAGRLRVAFLGGSTTFCAHASAGERTWPALVAAGLRDAHPELDVDYVNAGVGGYSTVQSLANLRHRVAPLDPDVIVIYHVTNDMTQISRAMARDAGLEDSATEEPGFFERISVAWSLVWKNLRWHLRTSDEHPKLDAAPAQLADAFRPRLTELVQLARATADEVVLVTFSYQQRREQDPERFLQASQSSLFFMPWLRPEDILAGYEALNDVVRDVAREQEVILVAGETSVPGDGVHFADSVHFLDPGERAQADRVLAALREDAGFQAYLAGR
jgi:lysophospholipase L1-like esterase